MTGGLLDNRRLIGFAFLAPAVAYIVLLIGVPFVTAFANSLSDVTVGNISFRCAGLRNFEPGLHAPRLARHAAQHRPAYPCRPDVQMFVLILSNMTSLMLTARLPQSGFVCGGM